jgi:hypothetical protein
MRVCGRQRPENSRFLPPVREVGLTPYATAQYSSGTVNDPSFEAFLLSQFVNATTIQSGVQIERLVATFDPNQAFAVIPEPTTFTIILAAGMMYFLVRKRVHSKIFS